jgi:hypothetical protein
VRFATMAAAQTEARRQRAQGLRSVARFTSYWSLDEWRWVPCWTVVLLVGRAAKGGA